jgi:uncharacterized protein YbjT (DUF2867 family)
MSRARLVLVTGATGKQGGAVARHLLAAGIRVRILARNPAKPAAVALQGKGAEVLRGDLEDISSLRPAVAGADGVFSVQNYWEKGVGAAGEIRQARNLADAAKEAGVKHFVQASVADAELAPGVEHFECKWEIEQYIDQIGLPRTFLGEVFFMESFLEKGGSMILPAISGTLEKTTRLHMISVEDIGAIATVVFQKPEQYVGTKIDIAGDRLTVDEMRRTFERVSGKKAKRWSLPSFVARLVSAEGYRQLKWNNDPGWQFSLDEAREFGVELTSFEQFVRKHRLANL